MILSALSLALAAFQTPAAPVQFNRVFSKGEKAEYKVHSVLNSEERGAGLDTWMPGDLDIIYKFNYEVTEMKADGICVMRYKRPTITEVEGETMEAQPKTKVEKLNQDLQLTVSPINEILDIKDLTPKKPEKKNPPAGGKKPGLRELALRGPQANQLPIGQFIGEIYRLALFVGSFESSLDFAPSLSFEEVKVGDTWKKTVGFSPQKLSGKGEKQAVQRLDYSYTYRGKVTVDGRVYERIDGKLNLKTDLASYIHQIYQVTKEQTGLKEIPLEFSASIEFDLDPKSHVTVRANGKSSGGFKIMVEGITAAAQEEKYKSTSSLVQLSHKR
jgi:hypothetical protein